MRIQDAVRQHNKNTVVIPNAFPYGQENYTHTNWTAGYKTRFLYAGGVSHLKDVELMSNAFDKIGTTAAVKNNARFLIAGYTPPMRKQFFSPLDMKLDNNNYNIVQRGVGEWDKMVSVFNRTQCAEVLPSRDLVDYIDFYDYADVSLVPLRDHSWNRLKSVLKLAEAANNWLQNIKQCIQESTERRERGLALGEYAKKNWELTEWNKVRKQVFTSLI
jgi:glycosyltransferase involved in cell wall biosynthesis